MANVQLQPESYNEDYIQANIASCYASDGTYFTVGDIIQGKKGF